MRNIKIKIKLIVGFTVTVLLTIMIGIVGIVSLNTSADNTVLLNERTNMAIMSARLERNVHQQRAAYRGAAVYSLMGMKDCFNMSITELELLEEVYKELYAELEAMIITDEGRRIMSDCLVAYNDYAEKRNAFNSIIMIPASKNEEIAQIMEDLTSSVKVLVATNAKFTDFLNGITDEQAVQVSVSASTATTIMINVIILATGISFLLSLYISRLISKPLSMMEQVLVQIGDMGDLNFPEEQILELWKAGEYKDEIGQSINAFIRMTERLRYLDYNLDLIAEGDLEADITLLSPRDTMGHSLKCMTNNLKQMFNDMRNVEADLRLARDASEESTKAKNEFLANMSHEIRTPMNGILGLLHLVSQTELTPKQRDYIEKSQISAKNLLRIINDILDFSKIEAGKLEMEYIEFSILDILEEVEHIFNSKIRESNLDFSIIVADNIPGLVKGDPLRLEQILINLIGNAVKFTHDGGVKVQVQKIEDEKDHISFCFSVKDTGIGMTSEQVDLLFAPFTQADTSITRRYGGTGLGLVICENLVKLMGGTIWVESNIGQGTTFYFTACFAPARIYNSCEICDAGGISVQTLPETINNSPEKGNILLVEDNEINQLIAKEMLESVGYTVDIAENGQEALDMLGGGGYELILMDIQMPVMDGISATKRIRENPEYDNLPIIAMSANAMSDDMEKSLECGMNEHITKPINPDNLYSTIKKQLNKG